MIRGMSSWFRIVGYAYAKESTLLSTQLRAHINDTTLGRRPIANLRPFILRQPINGCMNMSFYHAVNTVAASAIQMRNPFMLSSWAKYEPNPEDRQMILTRVWLRPREYDSLYWFITTECTTEARADYIEQIPTYPDHTTLGPLDRDPRRN